MNRKKFLSNTLLGTAGIISAPLAGFGKIITDPVAALPPEKVKEFVTAGHTDFEKTKQMLEDTPGLLYATWDWGGGDFETALEGAGHMGNKEIANYLIEKGARTNLYVLTMLGKTQLVKSYLYLFPNYLFARGPHVLTLLNHAQKGVDNSKELYDYFQSKGLKDTWLKL